MERAKDAGQTAGAPGPESARPHRRGTSRRCVTNTAPRRPGRNRAARAPRSPSPPGRHPSESEARRGAAPAPRHEAGTSVRSTDLGVARTISRPSSRLGTTGSTNVGAGRVAGIRSSSGRAVAGKACLARMTQRPGHVPADGRLSSSNPADTSASGAGASPKWVSSRSSVVKRTRVSWPSAADPGRPATAFRRGPKGLPASLPPSHRNE